MSKVSCTSCAPGHRELEVQDRTPYYLLNILCLKIAGERGSSGAPGEQGNGRTGFFGSPVLWCPWTPEPTSPEDDQYPDPNPRMILKLLSTFIKRLIDWFILVTAETWILLLFLLAVSGDSKLGIGLSPNAKKQPQQHAWVESHPRR